MAQALERQGVDFIYVDEDDLADPARADAMRQAEVAGWIREPPSAGRAGPCWRAALAAGRLEVRPLRL